MTASPRMIGPLIPVVAVACVVVAAVVYDSWPTSDTTISDPKIDPASGPVMLHQKPMPRPPVDTTPYIPGYPSMTRDEADASYDLQIAYLRDVLGKEIPTPKAEDREVWAQALMLEYPHLSPATRSELAQSSATLLRFRHAWFRLGSEEQYRIREDARRSGASFGPDAVLARHVAEGLRAQMYRNSVRGWAGFLAHIRVIPFGEPNVATFAQSARAPVGTAKPG